MARAAFRTSNFRELGRVGWSTAADGGPDVGGAGGCAPTACFKRSICALAFSPDGSVLLAVGTSGGDEHMMCAFDWSTGSLVAKLSAFIARPLGVYGLCVGRSKPRATEHATPMAERRTGKAARALGLISADNQDAASKKLEPMQVAVIGAAPALKFTTLSPPQKGSDWSLPKWQAGQYGTIAPPPRAVTSAMFAENAMPSTASAAGMLLSGGSNGRICWFDFGVSAVVLGSVEAHGGAAVTALAVAGDRHVASGGLDGSLHLWEIRLPPADAGANGKAAKAPLLARIHSYSIAQPLKAPKPARRGGGGSASARGFGDDSDDDNGVGGAAATTTVAARPDDKGGRGGKGSGRGAGRGGGGRGGSTDSGAGEPGGVLSPAPNSRAAGAIRSITLLPYLAAPTTAATAVGAASRTIDTVRGTAAPEPSCAFGGPRSRLTPHGAAAAAAQREREAASVASQLSEFTAGRQPPGVPSHSVQELARGQAATVADPLTSGVSIPTLAVGTSRGSVWRAGPTGSVEMVGGHHDRPTDLVPHPTEASSWASVGLDRQLLLWSAPHARPVQRALLPSPAGCVTFSHDGRYIATGHPDGTVRVHLTPAGFGIGNRGGAMPPHAIAGGSSLLASRRLTLVAVSGSPLHTSDPTGQWAPSARDGAPRTDGRSLGNCSLEALAFSANGARSVLIACGGHDKSIRVLELAFEPRPPSGYARPPLSLSPHSLSELRATNPIAPAHLPPQSSRRPQFMYCHSQAHTRIPRLLSSHPLAEVAPPGAAPLVSGRGVDSLRPSGPHAATASAALIGHLEPRCCCRGHVGVISHLDFSECGSHLLSNSNAREAFIWTLPRGQRVPNPGHLPSDLKMMDGSLLHGFDRMGCYSTSAAHSAVLHAAHAVLEPRAPGAALAARSAAEGGLLLAAGDEGVVRMYRAPCVVEAAPCREGLAHCDRIGCVRFLCDGHAAVSIGSYDKLVVRWEVTKTQRTGAWSYG